MFLYRVKYNESESDIQKYQFIVQNTPHNAKTLCLKNRCFRKITKRFKHFKLLFSNLYKFYNSYFVIFWYFVYYWLYISSQSIQFNSTIQFNAIWLFSWFSGAPHTEHGKSTVLRCACAKLPRLLWLCAASCTAAIRVIELNRQGELSRQFKATNNKNKNK